MGAHNAKNIIPVLSDVVEESSSKATFTIVAVDDQLSDPANGYVILNIPSAGESVPSKMIVDGNSNI